MRSVWPSEPLGDVCEIYQPKTISQKEMVKDGEYPVFGANGLIGRYHEFNHEDPQLLITCRGATCGSVNISQPFSWITGNAMVVRPKNEKLNVRFAEYFFRGAIDLSGVITGAAQPQVTRKSLAPVTIPLPPLEEQKRIVARLDQAFTALDRARAHAEANLADATSVLEACFTEAFDLRAVPADECHVITDIFKTSTGSTPPKSQKALYGNDILFVKPPELRDSVVGNTHDGLSDTGRQKARLAPADAILVSCIGNLGKIGLLDQEAAFNQQINAIHPNADIALSEFLFFQCRSAPFKNQLEARASGTTVSIVNKRQFNSLTLWVPSFTAQDGIVRRLKKIERGVIEMRKMYSQKLTDIADLRQSLLQRAFSGQLT